MVKFSQTHAQRSSTSNLIHSLHTHGLNLPLASWRSSSGVHDQVQPTKRHQNVLPVDPSLNAAFQWIEWGPSGKIMIKMWSVTGSWSKCWSVDIFGVSMFRFVDVLGVLTLQFIYVSIFWRFSQLPFIQYGVLFDHVITESNCTRTVAMINRLKGVFFSKMILRSAKQSCTFRYFID